MFLAVAGLATFGASCSSSDDNTPPPSKKSLVLSSDKTAVKEGEAVKFTVKVDGKEEAGSDLYIGSEKISNPHTFAKEGEYKVTAKKNDFNDSNVVTIKVSKDGGPQPGDKQLSLEATPAKVYVGEVVSFVVKEDGKIIADATITQVGGAAVKNGEWTADKVGTAKFKATKTGSKDSNEVSVVVEEKPVVPNSFIQLGSDIHELGFGIAAEVKYKGSNDRVQFELTDGRKVYQYDLQLFKGSSDDDYTEDLFKPGGVVQIVTIFIEAKSATSTLDNTPSKDWIWGGVNTVLDGQTLYGNIDNTSQIGFGPLTVNADGTRKVAMESKGNYTSPSTKAYHLLFDSVLSKEDYVNSIDKPKSLSAKAVSNLVIGKAQKVK